MYSIALLVVMTAGDAGIDQCSARASCSTARTVCTGVPMTVTRSCTGQQLAACSGVSVVGNNCGGFTVYAPTRRIARQTARDIDRGHLKLTPQAAQPQQQFVAPEPKAKGNPMSSPGAAK